MIYEFTLRFSLADNFSDMEQLVESLGAAGCDDALVGIGKAGRVSLAFTREAETAFDAVSSAIADIKCAIPGAKFLEAAPDLVGLTDVAEIVGCSRQNIRKIMLSGGTCFPEPVYEGKSALWRLSKVLHWLKDSKSYEIEEALLDIASTTMQFNIALAADEVGPQRRREIQALVR